MILISGLEDAVEKAIKVTKLDTDRVLYAASLLGCWLMGTQVTHGDPNHYGKIIGVLTDDPGITRDELVSKVASGVPPYGFLTGLINIQCSVLEQSGVIDYRTKEGKEGLYLMV